MKLITEEVSQVKFIVEGKGNAKKMFIEGVFLTRRYQKSQWKNVSCCHSF